MPREIARIFEPFYELIMITIWFSEVYVYSIEKWLEWVECILNAIRTSMIFHIVFLCFFFVEIERDILRKSKFSVYSLTIFE